MDQVLHYPASSVVQHLLRSNIPIVQLIQSPGMPGIEIIDTDIIMEVTISDCIVQERFDMIPRDLLKNGACPVLEQFFVLCEILDPVQESMELIPQLCVIGKTPDDQYYEVAMSRDCVEWLNSIEFPLFKADSLHLMRDVWEPNEHEIVTHGRAPASEKAQNRFIDTAEELVAKYGSNVMVYYMRHASVNLWLEIFRRAVSRNQ
ncbi:hypothetical protein PGQ11_002781 [Apiospora arundinis]|uniref:Uncharacterized protein n=1 Tax=Apiospora arundinis TaxID=335852 RepID=A0ABR2J3N4_9PEZI